LTGVAQPFGVQPLSLLNFALRTAVASRRNQHRVQWADGTATQLDVARWLGEPTPEEAELLGRAAGPVLDVGCGPGRHVQALHDRGVDVLGIDVLPEAIEVGRVRGAPIIEASVFGDVPRPGEWRTVLLLDGNIGIGGDAVALLRRAGELLAANGRAFVELEAPGVGLATSYGRLETPQGRSALFPWGRVGADAVTELAAASGFRVSTSWSAASRWFACLERSRHRRGPRALVADRGAQAST
jgi:SAM-dependent methyltransferase